MERICFSGVSKHFSIGSRRLLRGYVGGWLGRKSADRKFYALRDVSFTVRDGEGLAVIGSNGAGKSTLLSLATSLCHPDDGSVVVNGRIAALLELGSGFHSDLTGAENLYVNAALLGLSRKRTQELTSAIVEFSELGDFIKRPLRVYSSGMVMRLAFSVAIHAEPDILLIDEILAVGDHDFQAKCIDRILRYRKAGMTMLCVSHAPGLLREMCDRAIWLDHGQVVMEGGLEEVVSAYETGVLPCGEPA